ncbi:MAG: glycoside hydrolase family 68 protein [Natrialbaceae archaeon]
MTEHIPEADDAWAHWTREQAEEIERTAATVGPAVGPPETDPSPDHHVWDTWALRDRHGRPVTIDGWQVMFSLTAPADVLPGKRHDIAAIRYFVSKDGREWHDGGAVFDDDALGQRQWAGSALYDDGEVYLYYTAAGDEDSDDVTYTQRLAVGHGGRVDTSAERPRIEGPWSHEILLEPDGQWYETQAQSEGMTYTFRDPWFFEDPQTGETHLLFESNTPAPADACGGDASQREFNGCVGLAVSPSGDPLDWEFRPPILDGVCVNQELERPHVVVDDGRYYLFVSSHVHTFAPGLAGYDGLYGFVADSLRGEYRPLNGSGLVVTNPATAPFQTYSWMVLPHREELLVQSFLNYYEFDGESLVAIADLPAEDQLRRFGGTLAPTLRLAVDDERTRIRGWLDNWQLPPETQALPRVETEWEPPADALGPGRPETDRGDDSPYR